MNKRYKEFLIDIITKTYQIVLAIMIVTPIVTKKMDFPLVGFASIVVLFLLLWGGSISTKLKEE